jgi:hypothetical protein
MLAKFFCAFCAWAIVILSVSSFWVIVKQGADHVRKLHQIPCANCDFFTNDHRLKCTINPKLACTEEAINCRDFEYKTSHCNACQTVLLREVTDLKGKKHLRKVLKVLSKQPPSSC